MGVGRPTRIGLASAPGAHFARVSRPSSKSPPRAGALSSSAARANILDRSRRPIARELKLYCRAVGLGLGPAQAAAYPGATLAPFWKYRGRRVENESPGRRSWALGATGAGLRLLARSTVCPECAHCAATIVRFQECDISAMGLLRQHIIEPFSVVTKAPARIQPETERILALLMAHGESGWAKPFFCCHAEPRS